MAGNYAPRAHGTDHDHPSRLRRPAGAPVQPFSRNAPRVAPVGEGPGQPGQFGEGGNWQLLEGPLAGKIEHQDAALQGLSLRASGGGAESLPDEIEGADGKRDKVVRMPGYGQEAKSGFALRDDDPVVKPSPILARRADHEDHFVTAAELAAEDKLFDDLIARYRQMWLEERERGNKGRVKSFKLKLKKPPEKDERRPQEISNEELLAGYKKAEVNATEADFKRRADIRAMGQRSAAAKEKEASEALSKYMQERGLYSDEDPREGKGR